MVKLLTRGRRLGTFEGFPSKASRQAVARGAPCCRYFHRHATALAGDRCFEHRTGVARNRTAAIAHGSVRPARFLCVCQVLSAIPRLAASSSTPRSGSRAVGAGARDQRPCPPGLTCLTFGGVSDLGRAWGLNTCARGSSASCRRGNRVRFHQATATEHPPRRLAPHFQGPPRND